MPNSTPIPSLPPIPPSNLATQVVQVVVEKIFEDIHKSIQITQNRRLGGLGDDTNRVEMFLHPLAEHVKNKVKVKALSE